MIDERERYVGVFGEREFMGALFPGYLDQLRGAAFVRRSLDETLERRRILPRRAGAPVHEHRARRRARPTSPITQVAEIFLHHRVLIVPVVDGGRVTGLITRADFFRTIAERFLAR